MTTLQRIGTTPVYHEPLPVTDPGFLLFITGSTNPPDSLDLMQAWDDAEYAGWFVILPDVPNVADPPLDALAAAIVASGFFAAPPHTSLAWSSYDGTKIARPRTLALRGSAAGAAIDGDAPIGVGTRHGIVMKDGDPVTATAAGGDLDSLAISYAPGDGRPPPNGIGCTIAFHGRSRFCFVALGLIADPGNATATGADISLYYNDGVIDLRFPLFQPFANGLHLVAELTLDPCTNWWTPGGAPPRTSYAITGEAYALTQSGGNWTISPLGVIGIDSTLRTTSGVAVSLLPIAASFVPQPLAGSAGQWYLTPSGTFALQTSAAAAQLIGGLAATEFIGFTNGDVITFVPGSPAQVTGPGQLGTGAVTAWMSITPADADRTPATYSAQPKSSALYGKGTGIVPLFSPVLADLTTTDPPLFPLIPYAAADDANGFDYATFEQQIVMPVRLAKISASPGKLLAKQRLTLAEGAGGGTATTTPQGFLATVAGAGWSDLQFATNTRSTGEQQTLKVAAVTGPLQDALQSSELFLVVSLAAPFNFSRATIPISDWPFDIKLGKPAAHTDDFTNVLILKFCHGRTLDLVAQTSAWAGATTFNTDPCKVSTWLQNHFQAAIGQASSNNSYQHFVDTIKDENWSGILALRVDVPLAALPDDLRGLAAGINSSQFAAHHLGINATRVSQSGDTFTMSPVSSLFGLINYIDVDDDTSVRNRTLTHAAGAANGDPGYSFRVLTLFAEFQNSQIVSFSSRIILTVTELFGEAAQLQIDSSQPPVMQNAIALDGTLERRVANDGTTITVYVFRGTDEERFLLPQSLILNYVDVSKTEFSTLRPIEGTSVRSQFRMWGYLNFAADIAGFDLFSFGGDPADPVASGVAFANLIVEMNFDDGNPQGTVAFYFTPGNVTFDIGSSTVRPSSLFTALPLSLNGIECNASGTPQDAGYMPVVNNVNGSPLVLAPIDPANWYALTNVLNLGTMGALADLASFNAELLPAWSPGAQGTTPKVALLMKLPGTSPGKNLMSLQQVVKLEIGQIQLVADLKAGSGLVVSLNFLNIGLDFLGLKKIPSGAALNLALARGSSDGSLGWLASYSRTA